MKAGWEIRETVNRGSRPDHPNWPTFHVVLVSRAEDHEDARSTRRLRKSAKRPRCLRD